MHRLPYLSFFIIFILFFGFFGGSTGQYAEEIGFPSGRCYTGKEDKNKVKDISGDITEDDTDFFTYSNSNFHIRHAESEESAAIGRDGVNNRHVVSQAPEKPETSQTQQQPQELQVSKCLERIVQLAEKAVRKLSDQPEKLADKTKNRYESQVNLEILLKKSDEAFTFYKDSEDTKEGRKEILQITLLYGKILYGKVQKPLIRYLIIPWQNFSVNAEGFGSADGIDSISIQSAKTLLTVTDCAVIYFAYPQTESTKAVTPENLSGEMTEKEKEIVNEFEALFKRAIHYDEYSKSVENVELDLPQDVQVISLKNFPYYTDIEVAIPGSLLPEHSEWERVADNRMLRISFIPERGAIRTIWVKQRKEKKLIPLDSPFPGYQPKRTPDTSKDFMPSLAEKIDGLPESDPDNLESLISLFLEYKSAAEKNPGHWEAGNLLLGAREKEYIPSEEEIMLSEVGGRLKRLVATLSSEEIGSLLQGEYSNLNKLEYTNFTFTHLDVMGSGRFFYVESMSDEVITLRNRH